jgi:DNA-binding response OmpR family regulator
MRQTLVLSVSADPMILNTRNLILQSAGYFVVSVVSVTEAVFLFQDGDIDLVILCHSLPQQDRERLTSFIRASGSRVPICAVSEAALDFDAFADAALDKSPVEFLQAIGGLLEKRSSASPTSATVSAKKREMAAQMKAQISGSGYEWQNRENRDPDGTSGISERARKRAASR